MMYNSSALFGLMKTYSESKSELMPAGSLTEYYLSMCQALAEAISESQNLWQTTAKVSNIVVNGGLCPPNGPIALGLGTGSPGSIIGQMSGTGSKCVSKFPTSNHHSLTDATKSYIKAIGDGFEQVFNQFVQTASINNILVNGGTCTCQIIAGVPIPGTHFGGIGTLASLVSGVTSLEVTSKLLYTTMLGMMDSNILAQGVPTDALKSSLDAICKAIEEHHTLWFNTTQINNLQVNGGVTFPNGPITQGVGQAGLIV